MNILKINRQRERISKASAIIFFEALLGIGLSIFSLFAFIKLRSEVFEKEMVFFDSNIVNFIYSFRSPFLDNFMMKLSYLGGAQFIIFSAIILLVFFLLKNYKREAVLFIFIISMSFVMHSLLKNIIQRPRPNFYPLIFEKGYSFPSGHAMDSFVFYATLSYLVCHFTKSNKLTFVSIFFSAVIILAIGASRIYLGVHYPTDVLAGYLGGIFWFSSVLLIEKTFTFFKYL